MDNIENLKHTLYHYQFILTNEKDDIMKTILQPIVDKVKQEIIEAYPWTEEEIVEKINTGKVPDALMCCY